MAVFCCPTTRNINLQVIEKSDGDGIVDAVIRLSCEVGVPKFVLCDKQTSIERMLREAVVDMRDLQDRLVTEFGIQYQTCPVSGHNFHGQVERSIKSIREALLVSGADKKVLHATGLQTLMKLIENQLNNLPLGYAFGRDCDNSSSLKIVTPSMLRHGRNNSRSLDGPIKLADNLGKLMERVDETYQMWFKIWRDTWVPKLMRAPKWFNGMVDLEVGDLVYFKRTDTELGHDQSKWVVGRIDKLERGKDQKIRRVWIRYKNAGEDNFQVTERSARSVIKIFSLVDSSVQEDLMEAQKFMRGILGEKFSGYSSSGVVGMMNFKAGHLEEDECSPGAKKTCCSAHGRNMDLGSFLEEDLVAQDVVNLDWSFLEEAYYGDAFGHGLFESLTAAVMDLEPRLDGD